MSNSIDYVTIPIQKEPEKWKVLTESVWEDGFFYGYCPDCLVNDM